MSTGTEAKKTAHKKEKPAPADDGYTVITLRLLREELAQIDAGAEAEQRSRASFIRLAALARAAG